MALLFTPNPTFQGATNTSKKRLWLAPDTEAPNTFRIKVRSSLRMKELQGLTEKSVRVFGV